MKEDNKINYLRYCFEYFHEPTALIIFSVIIIGFFLWPINPLLKEFLPSLVRILIIFAALIILVSFWLKHKFRLPRHKGKTIGIVLSVYAENEKDLRVLKQDMIDNIEKNICTYDLSKTISLVIIPNHLNKNILTLDDLKRIHKKIRGHFYIQGRFKR